MTKANQEDYTATVHVEWHSRILNTSNRTVLPLHLKGYTCGYVGMAWRRSCGEPWGLRFTHQQGNCQPPFTTDISPKHDHKIWTQKMTSTCIKLWYKVFQFHSTLVFTPSFRHFLTWLWPQQVKVINAGIIRHSWVVYHCTKHGMKHLTLLIAANKSPVLSFCSRLTSPIKKTHIVEGLPVSVLTPPVGAGSLRSFEPAIDRKERMKLLISN